MRTTKFALSLTIILLVGSVAGATAFAPVASSAYLQPGQVLPLLVSSWEQVNSSGFGDQGAGEVSALGAFNGYLYAGTFNPIDPAPLYDGAQIFRSSDGLTWNPVTQPGFGDTHDVAPPAILDFIVFNTYLYASTGRGNAARIYRSVNGVNWAPVVNAGFNDPDNMNITALGTYNGKIYAGVTNAETGAHIWSSFNGDSNSWTQATTPALAESQITGFAAYDGGLYAAVESANAPAQIWSSYGGAWTAVVDDGFGDSDTNLTGGLAVFGGDLYVGAGNASAGAQLWRSSNGVNWTQVITPAFGDANNLKVELVIVFQNQLYASVKNTVTGLEVWRQVGPSWEQANLDGFEDSNNTASNWSNASENFLGQLYVGTSNLVDGGELWRMQEPYGVVLSPDDSLSGPAGQTVTYSMWILNSGSVADSFDLTASGQTWITSLSTSSVSLAPSASTVFTATVAIPPGAADQAIDTVTITATSQGDGSKTDSAVLTTTSIASPVYGVVLSADASLSGPAGGQVIYTLAITNTGNVVDTIDLLLSGNSWVTTSSDLSVALPAGGSTTVTITVAIPPGAANQETDAVTVTATSQGDGSKTDSAVLTTVSTGQAARIFLPTVMMNTP